MVCYPTVGGSGIVASQLGVLLAEAGHQVHFLAYQAPVRLELDRDGINFHPVSVRSHGVFRSPDYTLPLSVKMHEVCQQFDLDILHVHYAVPHATAALLARAMLGRSKPALVTTLHGTDVSLLGRDPAFAPAIRYALEQSDRVTAVSRSLKEETEALFSLAQPIEVVYNFTAPVSGDGTRIRQELGLRPDQVLALHMSNLRPVKRVDQVLEAFARSRCDHLLILAPESFAEHRATVERLGIGQRVSVVHDTQASAYVEACDLGLYASERESFGLAILETMAAGKPVVATQVGGVPEVVGETGLLSPPGEVDRLRSHLDRLVTEPELRGQLGERARQRAEIEFPPERALRGYLRVYQLAMGDDSAGPASADPSSQGSPEQGSTAGIGSRGSQSQTDANSP